MDIETALRRGVKFSWGFCLLSVFSSWTSLSFTTTALIILSTPLWPPLIRFYQKFKLDETKERVDIMINGVATVCGLYLYLSLNFIFSRWNLLLKLTLFFGFVQGVSAVTTSRASSQGLYNFYQKLFKIPQHLSIAIAKASGLKNLVLRFTALFLLYLCAFFGASMAFAWIVNMELPHQDLVPAQLLLNGYRQRLFAWLCGAFLPSGMLYTHRPIVQGKGGKRIRLLKLLRRWPLGPIRCELVESSLGDGVEYQAISYTWGAAARREPIIIEGKVFLVGSNVSAVLYSLSSYTQPRFVWIDSICINQRDIQEKGSQVALMRDIYSSAVKCVVWLDGVKDPFKVRAMLAGIWHEYMYGSEESCMELLRKYSEQRHQAGWSQLMNLYANPWFFRVWVIQEVVLATSITVLASGQPLQWDHLATVTNMLSTPPFSMVLLTGSLPGVEDDSPLGLKNGTLMATLRHHRVTGHYNPPITMLLSIFSEFLATEPVDMIYALLGLLNPENPTHTWLTPDYSVGAEETFTQVARNLMMERAQFSNDILSVAGIGQRRNITSLPSWVPDWTCLSTKSNQALQHFAKIQHAAKYLSVHGFRLVVSFPPKSEVSAPNVMRINGTRVGKVAHLSPVFTYTEHNLGLGAGNDVLLGLLKCQMEAYKLALRFAKQHYTWSQPVNEAFWRCLIGDTQFERPAPAELGAYCRLWEKELVDESGADLRDLLGEHYDEYVKVESEMEELKALEGLPESEQTRNARLWNSCRIMCCIGRAFCVTEDGYMGMVPEGAKVGDDVVLFFGFNTPFIMRQCHDTGAGNEKVDRELWRLVGEAYIHEMMDGQFLLRDFRPTDFDII